MAEPAASASLQAGTELGRYAITGLIGRGATLDVYAAKIVGAQGFEKAVALKVPTQAIQVDPGALEAFVARAKRAFSLSHANILGAIDLGRAELADGRSLTYLVTERARGVSLHELAERSRAVGVALPLAAVFRLGAEVAKALDHAHRRKVPIAHGALSERKLFLGAEGQLKLSDFGLAPESDTREPAADLVAVGALLGRLAGARALPAPASDLLAAIESREAADAGALHDRLLELSFTLASEREERSLAHLFTLVTGAERVVEAAGLPDAELDAALTQSVAPSTAQGRFVGRGEELSAIARALLDTRDSGACRGTLVGPSGVGKTRLLRELARRMPAEAGRVVFVSCSLALTRVPFGAAVVAARALASLSPSGRLEGDDLMRSLRASGCGRGEIAALSNMLGAPAEPGVFAAPLHEAMLTLVASAGVPVLLAIDEAHLLDTASAALLDAMLEADRAREVPLFIAVAARETTGDPWLTLEELDDDGVAQLLASRLGARVIPPELFELVTSRAGGNPLFIETLVKQLSEAALVVVERGVAELSAAASLVPAASLAELARGRLRNLPEREREALALMTVTDAGAEPLLLAAALDIGESEARALALSLESLGVARLGARGELFAASLYREAALSVTEAGALRAAHLRAASFLRGGPKTSDHAGRLVEAAAHFAAGGALSQAAVAYCEAARGFEIAGAPDVAASLFAKALPAIDSADEAARSLEALSRLAERANLSGVDLEEGIGHALALSDTALTSDARVALRCRLAVALGRHRALELADVLLAQAEAMSAPVLAEVVVTSRLAVAALADDPQRARDALELFASDVIGAGAPPVDVWLDAIDVALLAGDARRARGLLEVVPEAEATVTQRARVLAGYARLSALEGDRDAAIGLFDQAVALAKVGTGEPCAQDLAGRQGARALLESTQLGLDAGFAPGRAFARLSEVVEWARSLADRATLELALSELEALERGPLARAAIELRLERARAEGRHYDSLRLSMVVAERLYGRDTPALEALAVRADAAGLGGLAKRARGAKEPAKIANLPRV